MTILEDEMNETGKKLVVRMLSRELVSISIQYGAEACKKFLEIYSKEGIEKAIEFKNKLGGTNGN